MPENYAKRLKNIICQLFMEKRWSKDFYLGLAILAFSLIILFWLIPISISIQKTGERGLTPRFFPYCVSVTLAFLSSLLVYENRKTRRGKAIRAEDKRITKYTILCILLFFAYYLAIKVIGMVPASIIVLFILIYLYGNKSWMLNIIVSVIFVILLFLFFEKIAQVAIPRGLIFESLY